MSTAWLSREIATPLGIFAAGCEVEAVAAPPGPDVLVGLGTLERLLPPSALRHRALHEARCRECDRAMLAARAKLCRWCLSGRVRAGLEAP